MLEKTGRKGALLRCWWECKLVQLLWRTVWNFLKSLKTELPYYLAIPLQSIYLEKNMVEKDKRTLVFTAVLFTVAKTWEQPKCLLTEEQIKKMCYLYTMKYYSATEKNEIMPFAATWADLETVTLSEVSQTKKVKYCMILPK